MRGSPLPAMPVIESSPRLQGRVCVVGKLKKGLGENLSADRKVMIEFDQLQGRVGQELGATDWFEIDQPRIDAFAAVAEDHQWIHVDAERAAQGPFGRTIAHGFLTLSLCTSLVFDAIEITGKRMAINYGLERVRFLAPVPVDSRIRGRCRLKACEPKGEALRATYEITVELEGSEKPAAVIESISLYYPE